MHASRAHTNTHTCAREREQARAAFTLTMRCGFGIFARCARAQSRMVSRWLRSLSSTHHSSCSWSKFLREVCHFWVKLMQNFMVTMGSMGARGRAHVTAMLNAKGGAWYILRSSTAFQGRPAAVASAACSPLAASLPLAAAGGGADPVTKSSSPRRGSKKARTARFDNSRNAMRVWTDEMYGASAFKMRQRRLQRRSQRRVRRRLQRRLPFSVGFNFQVENACDSEGGAAVGTCAMVCDV